LYAQVRNSGTHCGKRVSYARLRQAKTGAVSQQPRLLDSLPSSR
jgi:hypothetical protein